MVNIATTKRIFRAQKEEKLYQSKNFGIVSVFHRKTGNNFDNIVFYYGNVSVKKYVNIQSESADKLVRSTNKGYQNE